MNREELEEQKNALEAENEKVVEGINKERTELESSMAKYLLSLLSVSRRSWLLSWLR